MKFTSGLAALMLSAMVACGGGGGGSGGSSSDSSGKVSITATAPAAPAATGSAVQFDVVVRNETATTVSNVVAMLTLGSGLTQTSVTCSASNGAACPTDPASMSVASLPGSGSLHYVVMATISAGTRGTLSASASVTANGAAPSSAGQVNMSVQAFSADVQVTAQGPATTLTSGGAATFLMTVTNAGPDAASNLQLENTVDPYQTLGAVTCAAQGGATCPATLGASMTVPTLPVGGTLVFSVPTTINANAIGPIANTLYASPDGDPVASNNVATATATTALNSSGSSSFVTLQSDSGDYIGAGQSYSYSNANAQITVTSSAGALQVNIRGNDLWQGAFAEPSALSVLQPGTYPNLMRIGSGDTTGGSIDWSGNGRGCGRATGTMTIDKATYSGSLLTAIDLRFEQHCEGAAAVLRGQIHWLASDTSKAAVPVNPPPASLWRAPADATPASGSYVYLQSDSGDFIGAGATTTYTQANAALTTSLSGTQLTIGVMGDDNWTGNFQGMNSLTQLQPGYYAGLVGNPFNPVTGGMSWYGNGSGCNTLTGWFAIDAITVVAGAVTAIDLRFEQHCSGGAAALHGQIHWVAGDTTAPAGPQNPVPASLWRAPAGATPTSGNYVYLQSDAGDFVGAGTTVTFTQANAVLTTTLSAAGIPGLGFFIKGDINAQGGFRGMNSISQLQPGYYPNLHEAGSNPVTGGLTWSSDTRGCDTTAGWFAIDSITYSAGALVSVDLRFEQHCDGASAALHGQIHWAADDPTRPPGPQNPVPADLWSPPAGSTPASGSYVYLQSDATDYIGGGQTILYTSATTPISVGAAGTLAYMYLDDWSGSFVAMNSIFLLQPGYYPNVGRAGFNNPTTGGLTWAGGDRGCNTSTGWFAIDNITYSGSTITSLDLRFEQHCDGNPAALHGKIHL